MKRVTYAQSIELAGRSLPINTTATSGCYVEILTAFHDQVAAMLTHYSRILIVGFDLHPRYYSADNTVISRFIRKAKKLITRHYQRYDMSRIGHLWVREQASAPAQHYHVALLLNARAVNSAFAIHRICERIWTGWEHPQPHRAHNRTCLVHRDDDQAVAEAMHCYSYYAKEATKGARARTTNDYSASRIKPRAALVSRV